jgi:hypothetical protein
MRESLIACSIDGLDYSMVELERRIGLGYMRRVPVTSGKRTTMMTAEAVRSIKKELYIGQVFQYTSLNMEVILVCDGG